MKVPLKLHAGGYQGDSVNVSSTRCVNFYPEKMVGEEKSELSLIGTPGLSLKTSIGTGPHRGSVEHNGNAYFVSGATLYKRDTAGTNTLIGLISSYSGNVSMASNGTIGNQILIVDGTNGWIYNGTTLVQVTDIDFPTSPTYCIFMDGYFLVFQTNSMKYYLSAFYNGLVWDGLLIASAERDSDKLINGAIVGKFLYLLGEYSTEVWYNSGNDFPFDPVTNIFYEKGIAAPGSVAKVTDEVGGDSLMWLGRDRRGQGEVVRAAQGKYRIASPPDITKTFSNYTTIADAVAYSYRDNNHTFYVLTFPTENKTWVYDTSTDLWHERVSGQSARHKSQTYLFFNGEHLVGDYQNGNIYKLDLNTYTDNGDPIISYFTTQHITQDTEQARHNALTLEVEQGTALLSGQGSNPLVSLEISDNGGHTFGNKRYAEMGIQGDYKKIIKWPFLGTARDRVYRVTCSEPIKKRIVRLLLDYVEAPGKYKAGKAH